MAIEIGEIEKWLYDALAGDSALTAIVGTRIYSEQRKGDLPAVVYQLQSPPADTRGINKRVMTRAIYTVKVIGQGESYTTIQAAANRIDAVLEGQALRTSNGVTVMGAERLNAFALTEVDEGVEYRQLGGIYRIWAH